MFFRSKLQGYNWPNVTTLPDLPFNVFTANHLDLLFFLMIKQQTPSQKTYVFVFVSPVCSPSSGGFQCRCEDQYRWSCDQCRMYGPCDNITDDTCGCINAIPPDGQYCQSADQHSEFKHDK